ncbi:hypothetical protein RCS94_04435 [Orbaceae bacterium ac157xtp]
MLIAPSSYGALSATSANTIKGNAPWFTGQSGANRFGFEVGGTTYSQGIGNINSSDIKEFDAGLRLSDFHIINLGVSDFNALTDYYDADGDEAHPITPFSMGTMTANWYENGSGTPISDMNKTLGCGSNLSLPLKLKIEIPNVQVHSRYGDPNNSGLTTLTKEYQISATSGICFVRPNQVVTASTVSWVNKNSSGTGDWNVGNGEVSSVSGGGYSSDFVVISNGVDSNGKVIVSDAGFRASANPKFPTTGFTGAEFYLVMTGNATDWKFRSNQLNQVVTVDVDGKVTLKKKPKTPITITAKLKTNTSIIYTYTFDPRNVWVVPKSVNLFTYDSAISECGGVTKLPTRVHLTNSPQNIATSSNLVTSNYYTRAIGGGVFNEWGFIDYNNYPASQWGDIYFFYWTRDVHSPNFQFIVRSDNGSVDFSHSGNQQYLACLG